jgi:aspartyl-tRNA(Asn)/glutamyl-tRNA(Gln) amidotransferase subunit A
MAHLSIETAEAAAELAPGLPIHQDLTGLTLAQASRLIRSGEVTAVQLTEAVLGRIAALDRQLNSYITVCGENAIAEARMLDEELAQGKWRGPLHGIPLALKDNIDTLGTPTTAASNVYRERLPSADAEVTRRLREAGAVIAGKLNLHEFAAGGTGHVSAFGATHNPWDLDRVTGGSSSGSGAAVLAGLCFGALGTDTGGSIRIPSSWCGIVGLKPTYGLVSIRGIVPLIYTLDHCGPMVRSVEDAAILLNVLAGYDPLDAASVAAPAEDYVASMEQSVAAVRLGAPAEFYVELDPEVESAMKAATQVLSELTAGVSSTAPLPPCGDILHFFAETLAFHAKYIEQTQELYQSATGRFLKSFPPPLATHYIQARETLTALRRTIDSAFDTFDLVILPTERVLPTTIAAAEESDRIAEETGVPSTDTYVAIANTYQFNLYGLPALTMPCGFSKEGLPIGMTIAGPRFSEGKILALAKAFESATDWHTRTPALSA